LYVTTEFKVPTALSEAWDALLNLEEVVHCLPGAQITEKVDDSTWHGTMDIKLGAISLSFKGEVRLERTDLETNTILMWAQGSEARGKGVAQGTVTSTLMETNDGTTAAVTLFLQLSGQVAQFGRGMIETEAERIVGEFAECLSAHLGG
jgi:carbon monoxide dehydrogenase subunit G